jgi:hypothetical protein
MSELMVGILGALFHSMVLFGRFPQNGSAMFGRIWLKVSAFCGRSFGILGAYLPICPIEETSSSSVRACAFVENEIGNVRRPWNTQF